MSTAGEIASSAPDMLDEDLAYQLQLEEDSAYQQQLEASSRRCSRKFQSPSSSSPSPASSSRRRVVRNVGPYPDVQNAEQSGDEKLRELADRKKWQVCSECQRMIELNEGCYHMTCLCGNEFCYTCGAKWKNKAASCACKLWDENNIIRSRAGVRFFRAYLG